MIFKYDFTVPDNVPIDQKEFVALRLKKEGLRLLANRIEEIFPFKERNDYDKPIYEICVFVCDPIKIKQIRNRISGALSLSKMIQPELHNLVLAIFDELENNDL